MRSRLLALSLASSTLAQAQRPAASDTIRISLDEALDGSFMYLRIYASPFQVKAPSDASADSALAPIAKLFSSLPFGRVNQYTPT